MGSNNSAARGYGHHPTPGGIIHRLDKEWAVLARSPALADALDSWGRIHPSVAEYSDALALIGGVGRRSPAGIDAVFAALLTTARATTAGSGGGETGRLAARVVLQLMLPRVVRMARKLAHVQDAEDREAVAVAAMTEAIGSYPIARFPTCVPIGLARRATHLAWETYTRPVWDRLTRDCEVLVDFDSHATDMNQPAGPRPAGCQALPTSQLSPYQHFLDGDRTGSQPSGSAQEEVIRLLVWAVGERVITVREASDLARGVDREGTGVAAAQRGISRHSVHQSRWRALQKLIAAAPRFDPSAPLAPFGSAVRNDTAMARAKVVRHSV